MLAAIELLILFNVYISYTADTHSNDSKINSELSRELETTSLEGIRNIYQFYFETNPV